MTSPLTPIIQQEISEHGPMSIARYMQLCLMHPQHGYYQNSSPIGTEGDFITAPEISQLFGEMLAIWCIQTWEQLGKPSPVNLLELGPGRGTLMRNLLRVLANKLPIQNVHLVEQNTQLKQQQQIALSAFDVEVMWHDDITDVPRDQHYIIITNEFFDALPIHQYVREGDAWSERCVGIKDDELAFCTTPLDTTPPNLPNDFEGDVYEYCPAAHSTLQQLCERLNQQKGAALIVDYGYAEGIKKDTFQAVKNHQYINPLTHCAQADLTAHVDFGALLRTAAACGASAFGAVTQGNLLQALGIGLRTQLAMQQQPHQAQQLLESTTRLIAPDQMGELFKAIAILPPDFEAPYGF